MKLLHLLPLAAFTLASLATAPLAHAEAPLESRWTSNDGVTIWARLVGWDGTHFILKRSGHDYLVLPERLTTESRGRARKMLDLAAGKAPRAIEPPVRARRVISPAATLAASAESPPPLDSPAPDRAESGEARLPEIAVDGESLGMLLPARPIEAEPVLRRPSGSIRLEGKRATPPAEVPAVIRSAIEAGNRLQTKCYKWGGGRSPLEDSGYDCSGSVSYVLIKAGLLNSPGTSRSLMHFGEPGPGRWITLYARDGHVFMTVCGLRLDTGGSGGRGESGPRWRPQPRGTSGFVMRHPAGL